MKLFEMKNWQLLVSAEVWGLLPFKKLLERDKSEEKEIANKEMLFIFFYSDIKSDYLIHEHDIRVKEIRSDIGLPQDWEFDDDMANAVKLYESAETIVEKLYKQVLGSAEAVGNYLEDTKTLLEERDGNGKPVTTVAVITTSLGKMPKLMSDIKASYREVVKEKEDNANKKTGSKTFNIFEGGF